MNKDIDTSQKLKEVIRADFKEHLRSELDLRICEIVRLYETSQLSLEEVSALAQNYGSKASEDIYFAFHRLSQLREDITTVYDYYKEKASFVKLSYEQLLSALLTIEKADKICKADKTLLNVLLEKDRNKCL